jgi:hypothetical protein
LALAALIMSVPPAAVGASSRTSPGSQEHQVTATNIYDYHFDWGRDGCYCPTCNHGQGNNRLTFTDRGDNLWLAYVDPTTGAFSPSNGMGTLVDTNAAYVAEFGDGAYWMWSSTNDSQIVYSKYPAGVPHNANTAGSGIATMAADGTWTGQIVAKATHAPLATLDLTDPSPAIDFQNATDQGFLWELANAPNTGKMVPWSTRGQGNSRRWVRGEHSIVFTTGANPVAGVTWQQVFTYDTTLGQLTQLTFDPTNKEGAFMWRAPEFNNDYVFFTLINNGATIQVYHQQPDSNGNLTWTAVKTINMPSSLPYIWSPEPFVFNGKSYIFFQLSSYSGNQSFYFNVPTQIAMTGIDPGVDEFTWLTDTTDTAHVRSNPQYYITPQGPWIFYNMMTIATATRHQQPLGVWYASANLGVPAGNPCDGTPAPQVAR